MLKVVPAKAKPEKFVVIGGGTGSFSVLTALKGKVPQLTALVSMADDGGSTGVLRDELGVLPPGDVRQCLVALSEAPKHLRELFNYRFTEGSLAGHSFGNLFLSAVERMTNNFGSAVHIASEVLRIDGTVMPITLEDVRLAIAWGDEVVRGEGTIDVLDFGKRAVKPHLFLEPNAVINPEADTAIRAADVIIIAPGDLYTSLGALLVVDGVAEALAATNATIVYVCNLVVKPGQTAGFTVADHAAEIERFAGSPILDIVLYNTGKPDAALLEKYLKTGEAPVEASDHPKNLHYQLVGENLLTAQLAESKAGDALGAHRSYIRHDAIALAEGILGLFRA